MIAPGKEVRRYAIELDAYRADPQGKPRGGVVVIQEIFGVNHHIKSVADRYAQLGYLAIAPALFDRVEKGVDLGYDGSAMDKARATVKAFIARQLKA